MVSKKILASIKDLYLSGIDEETIAEQYDLSVDEIYNIIDSIDEEDTEEKKSKKKDIEDRMDSNAETSITGEVVRRTKGLALSIQTAKEEIGDYIYNYFENTGMTMEDIVAFSEYAIEFFVENHEEIDKLKEELEVAEDMIEKLWEVADEKAEKERIVKEYVLKCAVEGTPVDNDFVRGMLFN